MSAVFTKTNSLLPQQRLHGTSVSEAPATWVPSPLPLTAGSSVAGLAEALHVGALMDATDGKTETIRGKQGGAVTPEVVPGERMTWAGLG